MQISLCLLRLNININRLTIQIHHPSTQQKKVAQARTLDAIAAAAWEKRMKKKEFTQKTSSRFIKFNLCKCLLMFSWTSFNFFSAQIRETSCFHSSSSQLLRWCMEQCSSIRVTSTTTWQQADNAHIYFHFDLQIDFFILITKSQNKIFFHFSSIQMINTKSAENQHDHTVQHRAGSKTTTKI